MQDGLVTRFAPSPTGALHPGGVRTALYNWLISRHSGGKCILRIEDTDRERSTIESRQQIVDSFAWLELDFDDLYHQSDRTSYYDQAIASLLENGRAYVCDCSNARLEQLRERQLASKQKPRYDGHCRDSGMSWEPGRVVRLRAPQSGTTSFCDRVFGEISVANAELDDLIIQRSDGSPTYNFCCVIDDHAMGVTTVVRGDDHLNNTPRQIHIYHALNYPLPQFAHLPMILGSDGKRLSKRHGARGVLDYRDAGLLPDAVINYLARLGWSHSDDEIFQREDLIRVFSLDTIQRSPATFNETRLWWVNRQHLKLTDAAQLLPRLRDLAQLPAIPDKDLVLLTSTLRERVDTLIRLAEEIAPYASDTIELDPKAAAAHLTPAALPVLRALQQVLTEVDWDSADLHQLIQNLATRLGLKMGKVGMPLRVAITGREFSPAIDQTLLLLGKDKVLQRLAATLAGLDTDG